MLLTYECKEIKLNRLNLPCSIYLYAVTNTKLINK